MQTAAIAKLLIVTFALFGVGKASAQMLEASEIKALRVGRAGVIVELYA